MTSLRSLGVALVVSALTVLVGVPSPSHAQVPIPYRIDWGETRTIGDVAPGMDRFWKPPTVPSHVLSLELFGGSTAPLGVDLTARLVILDHLLFSLTIGVGTYGHLLGDLASQYAGEAGRYVATLVANGLFSARAAIGVRPFDDLGLELDVGYVVLHRQSAIEASRLAATIHTQDAEGLVDGVLTAQGAHVELGWSFYVDRGLLVRPALGALFLLDASAEIRDGADHRTDIEDTIERDVTTYGISPTLSLSLGGVVDAW